MTGELANLSDHMRTMAEEAGERLRVTEQMAERQEIRIRQMEDANKMDPSTIFTLTMLGIFLGSIVALLVWGVLA